MNLKIKSKNQQTIIQADVSTEIANSQIVHDDTNRDSSTSDVDVRLHVVATADARNAHADKRACATPNQSSSFAVKLAHNKLIAPILGMTAAIAVSAYLFVQTQQAESILEQHKAAAELQDYASKAEAASKLWHQAIDDAQRLNFREKVKADLYLRAARAEINSAFDRDSLTTRPRSDLLRAAESDSSCALRIFRHIPDTRAEQIVASGDLINALNELIKQGSPYVARDPAAVTQNDNTDSDDKDLKARLFELETSMPNLGRAALTSYLRRTHNVHDLTMRIAEKIATTKEDDSKTLLQLIFLLCEVIYYNDNDNDGLRYQFEMLDHLYALYSSSPGFRTLNLDDHSTPTHCAIIEYTRRLGEVNDESIRSKLMIKRAEAYKTDLTLAQQNDVNEDIDCLEKLIALKVAVFGSEHADICSDLKNLGIAYGIKDDFRNAERCFKQIESSQPAPYRNSEAQICLAEMHSQQGRFDSALKGYSELLTRKNSGIPPYEIWFRIAKTNFIAGRFKEGKVALKKGFDTYPNFGCTAYGCKGGVDLLLE